MIYFLEDDPSIRKLVIYTLNSQGMEAEGFELPSQFWAAMERQLPSLVLLDLMLPEEDGLHILKRIRAGASTARLPVILITAKGTEYDKVVGLDGRGGRLHRQALRHDGADGPHPHRPAPQRRGGGAGPRPYFGPTAHRSGPPSGAGPRAGSHPHPERIPAALPFGGACGDRIHPGPAAQHHLGL